tara:strand:- start:3241 stop:4023 length:783 start_codon:yes stop_codon:yes gene_type:complete
MKNNKISIKYQRVSSKGQEDNTSLSYQSKRLDEWTRMKKVDNVMSLQDVDSGGSSNRGSLKVMEDLVSQGLVDTIYITKLDRLYRSVVDGARFIRLCRNNDTHICAVDEGISTKDNTASNLQINILLSIADYERECIALRTSQGKLSTFQSGKRAQGNIPIGYKKVNGELVVDEDKAVIVREIFTNYIKLKSLSKVKHYLDQKQYTTNNNKPFTRKSIYNIIKNPTYISEVFYKGDKGDGNHLSIIGKFHYTRANNILSK